MNRAYMPIAQIRQMSARDLVNFMEQVDNKSIEEVELCKRLREFLSKETRRPVTKLNRNITNRSIQHGTMV